MLGTFNMLIGWSIARKKMRLFVFVAIYLNQISEIKEAVIILLVNDSEIKKRKRNLILMLNVIIVLSSE